MENEAVTFRAEPELMTTLRNYAGKSGISVNRAMKRLVSSALGVGTAKNAAPRNGLSRLAGRLGKGGCREIREAQKTFSKIDAEMWK